MQVQLSQREGRTYPSVHGGAATLSFSIRCKTLTLCELASTATLSLADRSMVDSQIRLSASTKRTWLFMADLSPDLRLATWLVLQPRPSIQAHSRRRALPGLGSVWNWPAMHAIPGIKAGFAYSLQLPNKLRKLIREGAGAPTKTVDCCNRES